MEKFQQVFATGSSKSSAKKANSFMLVSSGEKKIMGYALQRYYFCLKQVLERVSKVKICVSAVYEGDAVNKYG